MMKLSLMKDFFRTVDEEWSSPIADQIASRWFASPDSVRIMRASANFVCLVVDSGKHYTLRFNTEEFRPIEALQSELRLLLSLRNFNLPVQNPLKSLDDNYSELITTDLGRFTAVVFNYIPGEFKELPELKESEFQRWGAALGSLHHTLEDNQFTLSIKHPRLEEQLKSAQPPTSRGADEKSALLDWLSKLEKGPSNYGVIHYDFELDNLIWDESGQIHIIDFDDTAISWYMADLAFALSDLYEKTPQLSDPRLQAFLTGYRSHKTLAPDMLLELGGFIRLKHFLTYHRLLKAVDLETDPSHPQWTNQLINKLTGNISALEEHFSSRPVQSTPIQL
jgi:Ser/Thr protein kinase RdoA (MazF antagonist)